MYNKYSRYFICPKCSHSLELRDFKSEGTRVIDGLFQCPSHDHAYPLINGIPRIIAPELLVTVVDHDKIIDWISMYHDIIPEYYKTLLNNLLDSSSRSRKAKTASYYAYQWRKYDIRTMSIYDEAEFFRLTGGALDINNYAGKKVADIGAGQGRFTGLFLKAGVGEIVCLDLGEAIELAYEKYIDDDRVLCLQTDIYNIPLVSGRFDLAMCIGVLQHLPDPPNGFKSVSNMAKPNGGRIFAWTYNVSSVTPVIQSLRFLVSWMPIRLLWYTAAIPAIPRYALSAFGKMLRLVNLDKLADNIPLSQYENYSFHYLHVNTFDFLHTPIINYFNRCDLEQWMKVAAVSEYELIERFPGKAGSSWVVSARRNI